MQKLQKCCKSVAKIAKVICITFAINDLKKYSLYFSIYNRVKMAFICETCEKEFTTNSNLTVHQKKAKFCLRLRKELNNEASEKCIYCEENFKSKIYLQRHYETCKIKKEKEVKENEQKKDELINKLQNEVNEKENKLRNMVETLREDLNNIKTELRIKEEQIKMKDDQHLKELRMKDEYHLKEQKMKDEIISKLEKEIDSLKVDSKDTIKTIFEKEDKIRDSLFHQNTIIQKDTRLAETHNKTINNNTSIVNNYGIKPFTSECVINAFESYHLKHENAFNAYRYDSNGLLKFELELVFYGIIRELKEYYGITDVSREKIVYNDNGEMTLTTVQEFIRTNVVMNNIDTILEWISNLRTQIFKKLEDGFTVTNDGEFKELDSKDKQRLHEKEQTLMNIYELFKQSKERGDVHMYISDEMSQAAMKHGKAVEKSLGKKLKSLTSS